MCQSRSDSRPAAGRQIVAFVDRVELRKVVGPAVPSADETPFDLRRHPQRVDKSCAGAADGPAVLRLETGVRHDRGDRAGREPRLAGRGPQPSVRAGLEPGQPPGDQRSAPADGAAAPRRRRRDLCRGRQHLSPRPQHHRRRSRRWAAGTAGAQGLCRRQRRLDVVQPPVDAAANHPARRRRRSRRRAVPAQRSETGVPVRPVRLVRPPARRLRLLGPL